MAAVCLGVCSVTGLSFSAGQRSAAATRCLASRRSRASRVSRCPWLVGKSGSSGLPPRSSIRTRRTAVVILVSGVILSLRPFPQQLTCAPLPRCTSAMFRPVSSGGAQSGLDRGHRQRVVSTPVQVARSGALISALMSWGSRNVTSAWVQRCHNELEQATTHLEQAGRLFSTYCRMGGADDHLQPVPAAGWPVSRLGAAYERAAAMGFDWVFANPVQRPGASGSIYSIADYFELNPALIESTDPRSGEDQLTSVLQAARDRGLRAMADLMIDHCAIDSGLVSEHPEWVALDSEGAVIHPSCDQDGGTLVWADLAQLDHRGTADPEGLYQYCVAVVHHLLGLGFDGFRCDAAYGVPAELWRRLIADTKDDRPLTVFVAETLGCTPWETAATAAAGFNYVCNSATWWDFRSHWLLEQRKLLGEQVASIGFPESHDTPRLAEEMHGNANASKLWYLFTALFSAGCLMPIGFEFGFRRALHVFNTRPEDWETTSV